MSDHEYEDEYHAGLIDGNLCPCGKLRTNPDNTTVWFDTPTGNFTVGIEYTCPETGISWVLSAGSSAIVELDKDGTEIKTYPAEPWPFEGRTRLCPCTDPTIVDKEAHVQPDRDYWILKGKYSCENCHREFEIEGMAEYILQA